MLKLISDNTGPEPVSNAEARDWARLSASEPEWIVTMLVASARARAEHLTGRTFTTKTWELYLDEFPDGEIPLQRTPVDSVTWLKYLDTSNVEQTVPASKYTLDGFAEPARIIPVYGYSWPQTIDMPNAVKVRFVEGWGTNPNGWQQIVRQFILVTLATDAEFRQAVVAGLSVADLPNRYYERVLDPLRIHSDP